MYKSGLHSFWTAESTGAYDRVPHAVNENRAQMCADASHFLRLILDLRATGASAHVFASSQAAEVRALTGMQSALYVNFAGQRHS